MESILTSIKKLLGIEENYEHFDQDIIIHINSTLMILTQLGVGPSKGFMIYDKNSLWSDFIANDAEIEAVKTYTYLKVKLLFDPPLSSSVIESINRSISELEWRINIIVDTGIAEDSVNSVIDYNELINLPSINGETLKGNYDEKDPTVDTMSSSDVDSAWNKIFNENVETEQ